MKIVYKDKFIAPTVQSDLPATLDNMIKVYDELIVRYPNYFPFTGYDNDNQAGYTSFHITNGENLNEVRIEDVKDLDPDIWLDREDMGDIPLSEAGADYINIDFYDHPAFFPIRYRNFMEKTGQVSFQEVCDLGCTMGLVIETCEPTFFEANNDPDELITDTKMVGFELAGVNQACEAICLQPNGYFMGDWSPFENYAVAKHFEDHHNYRLMAMGAEYMVFWRPKTQSASELSKLAQDIAKLYNEAGLQAIQNIEACLKDKRHLVLSYAHA